MGRGYVAVEGHGETNAVLNLLVRISQELPLSLPHWAPPLRWSGLHKEDRVRKLGELIRRKPDADCLLVLRDADGDGDCPKDDGPRTAGWLRAARLPFPAATVMFRMEYEVLFLVSLPALAGAALSDENGRPRVYIPAGTVYPGTPEDKRGVKEWLSKRLTDGRQYKPSIDQLPLTRGLDLSVLRGYKPLLFCFGTLERALCFLAAHRGQPGAAYP